MFMAPFTPSLFVDLPNLGRVCRLGLATRGNGQLTEDSVLEAIAEGINYLNWCGHPKDHVAGAEPRRSIGFGN